MRRRSGGTTRPGAERQRSPTRISPDSGARNPPTSRSVVVLPQPDGPSNATSSPGSTASDRRSTAATSPYRSVTASRLTPGTSSSHTVRTDSHVRSPRAGLRLTLPHAEHVAPERPLHEGDGGERQHEHHD